MRYRFGVLGYVVMPEHVHLLVGEPQTATLATALQAFKQSVSRTLALRQAEPFWQARYYDLNVWTNRKRIERLHFFYPPQPGDARIGFKTRGLGMEQLLSLSDRCGRRSGDRVRVDGTAPRPGEAAIDLPAPTKPGRGTPMFRGL